MVDICPLGYDITYGNYNKCDTCNGCTGGKTRSVILQSPINQIYIDPSRFSGVAYCKRKPEPWEHCDTQAQTRSPTDKAYPEQFKPVYSFWMNGVFVEKRNVVNYVIVGNRELAGKTLAVKSSIGYNTYADRKTALAQVHIAMTPDFEQVVYIQSGNRIIYDEGLFVKMSFEDYKKWIEKLETQYESIRSREQSLLTLKENYLAYMKTLFPNTLSF